MSAMFLRKMLRDALVALGLIPKPRFVVRHADRQPSAEGLQNRDIIAVRGARGPKWACFFCPCASGEVVRLGLDRDRHPRWNLKVDWLGRPTIYPSIWQRDRCHCHFWIKGGEIAWCDD
jgi:hypothetical protein